MLVSKTFRFMLQGIRHGCASVISSTTDETKYLYLSYRVVTAQSKCRRALIVG